MGSSYKPVLIMVALQFAYAGQALFSKAIFIGGTGITPTVFVLYRQAIATLLIAPLSFISTRKDPTRVSLTLKSFSWIFAASLIGVTANMNAYFEGINLASSTAATAISNLIPALTFLIAAILGMEKINSRSIRSGAKIVGTIICVVGAMAIAFQEGPKLLNSELLGSESDGNLKKSISNLILANAVLSFVKMVENFVIRVTDSDSSNMS
ncbi:WAT1-related protein At4g28040 [Linum perenne]